MALAGFGLDSLIEIGASTVVLWELANVAQEPQRRAMRLIGVAFVALATYLAVQSTVALVARYHSHHSRLGIAWTALTAAVMFALASGKATTGAALDNQVLRTEGRVTMIDAILASAVLIGLVLNASLGWWWADPASGYVLVFYGLGRLMRHSPADPESTHPHMCPFRMSRPARLTVVLMLNLLLVAGLIAVGLSAHSLGVLAEGADYLADAAAIGVSLLAIWLSKRPPTPTRPHGYPRATTFAALVNGGWLLILSLLVVAGGIERLATSSHEVHGMPVLIVSAIAAGVMLGGALLLGGDVEDLD